MRRLQYTAQKELTSNVYNTKRNSTEWFIIFINTDFAHTYAHTSNKGGKMK